MEFVLKRWMRVSAITRVEINEDFLNYVNKILSGWIEEDGTPCFVKSIEELVKILDVREEVEDHKIYSSSGENSFVDNFCDIVNDIAADFIWDEDYEIYDSEVHDWEFDVRED